MIEILIVGLIMIFVFTYVGAFNFSKFVDDNKALFTKLKEDDYEFLVRAKYGEQVDVDEKKELSSSGKSFYPAIFL